MSLKRKASPSEIVLGELLQEARRLSGLSKREVGKKLKVTEQQITKYETGAALVPMAKLEKLGEILGCPIQKKLIRRISFSRKLETEADTPQQDELIGYYQEAFELDDL